MVISLLIFLAPLVSSLVISFSSSEEVKVDEEFIVKIEADSGEAHDVKIFVHSSDDDKISRSEYISDIYHDGTWLDSWFYIKESFPEEKEYKIKVFESPGAREICVRLRKSSTQTTSINCKEINVLEAEKTNEKNTNTEQEKTAQFKPEEKENAKQNLNSSTAQTTNTEEKIYLNQKTGEKATQTSLNKLHLWLIYGFIFMLISALVLLALRRL